MYQFALDSSTSSIGNLKLYFPGSENSSKSISCLFEHSSAQEWFMKNLNIPMYPWFVAKGKFSKCLEYSKGFNTAFEFSSVT